MPTSSRSTGAVQSATIRAIVDTRTVVLSTGTDTLLRVKCAFELCQLGIGVNGAEEDGFILYSGGELEVSG